MPISRDRTAANGPVAFIILIVGGIVVALALLTEMRHQPPVWLHLMLWLPLTVILVLALMRPFKALLIALQYKHRRDDFQRLTGSLLSASSSRTLPRAPVR